MRQLLIVAALAACSEPSGPADAAPKPFSLSNVAVTVRGTASSSALGIEVRVQMLGAPTMFPPSAISAFARFRGTMTPLARGSAPYRDPTMSLYFVATIGAIVEADEMLEVALVYEGDSAETSLTFPPPFTLTSITGSWEQPPIDVTWSPSGVEPLYAKVEATPLVNHSCIVTIAPGAWPDPVPDTGMVTLDTRKVVLDGLGFPCGSKRLVLNRDRRGTGSTKLGASTVIATQSRHVSGG